MSTVDAPIRCELVVTRLAKVRVGWLDSGAPEWDDDDDRRKELPEKPEGFKPMLGSYREVMEEATRLNAMQVAGGRWDYLYNPDVAL